MKALAPWRPFRELSTLHRDVDAVFSRFFGEEGWSPSTMGSTAPAIESFIRNGELVIRADLPGIDPKKVDLAVESGRLVMRGEREEKAEKNEQGYLYREVFYGRFERAVSLPPGVDTDSIKAKYHDGVLEVTMKAPKELAAKKVPITVH
jgi:HSP20 family protein